MGMEGSKHKKKTVDVLNGQPLSCNKHRDKDSSFKDSGQISQIVNFQKF